MSLLVDLFSERKFIPLSKLIIEKIIRKNSIGESYKDQKAIFVLSTGRVGTQTLARILTQSSKTIGFHEPTPKLYSLSKEAFYNSEEERIEIASEAYNLLRKDHLKFATLLNKRYVETSPQNTFLGPAIKKLLPNSKFIHLIRKPEDVILSGINRGWYSGHNYDKFRILPKTDSVFFDKWKSFSQLEKNVWLWTETNNWIKKFVSKLPEGDSFLLHSEKMFNNEKGFEELFSVFGIDNIKVGSIKKILAKKLNKNSSHQVETITISSIDEELLGYFNEVKASFYAI